MSNPKTPPLENLQVNDEVWDTNFRDEYAWWQEDEDEEKRIEEKEVD